MRMCFVLLLLAVGQRSVRQNLQKAARRIRGNVLGISLSVQNVEICLLFVTCQLIAGK